MGLQLTDTYHSLLKAVPRPPPLTSALPMCYSSPLTDAHKALRPETAVDVRTSCALFAAKATADEAPKRRACLASLRAHFLLSHRELAALDGEALAPLDALLLCTTEGPPLSAAELAALRAWVERGGALIVSAFSNWSAHEHYARDTVGWLGLQAPPAALSIRARAHGHAHAHTHTRTRPAPPALRAPTRCVPWGCARRPWTFLARRRCRTPRSARSWTTRSSRTGREVYPRACTPTGRHTR